MSKLVIPVERFKLVLKLSRPDVYLLHMAAWRAGYSVNGIAA